MQKDIEITVSNNPHGIWMIVTGWCKFCDVFFNYKFKGE